MTATGPHCSQRRGRAPEGSLTPEELEAQYDARGLRRGRRLLLAPSASRELIATARLEGVRILGINGFDPEDSAVRPRPEHSVDLAATVGNCWTDADAHVGARSDANLLFEVVLDWHYQADGTS